MSKITYVLTVSEYFPKSHYRSGQKTGFVDSIALQIKIHTIRGNYELWKKRADKINEGKAILSVRVWTGKPYNSKQREIFVFEKIGLEKIELDPLGFFIDSWDNDVTIKELATNDGLTEIDFKDWFKGKAFSEPKAIIHFTDFRYGIQSGAL